jgi:hypothetical protein
MLPILLCLACGASSGGADDRRALVPVAPTPTLAAIFAPASRDIQAVAASFLKVTCEYDATTAGRLDFLQAVEHLTTPAELARLKASPRAQLPWRALRDRGERTTLAVNGITQTSSAAATQRVLAWVKITTRTRFATVHSLELVTLTLVPTSTGLKVDHAEGAGL